MDITTLAWHPIHDSMIATGDYSGAIYFYLLDAFQSGSASSMAMYSSSTGSGTVNLAGGNSNHTSMTVADSGSAVGSNARSVEPIQTIAYGHESAIWSMEFHPMGHILCTGSNDKFTKFWCRARPGDEAAFQDTYHLGPEASAGGERHATHSGHF